MLMLPKFINLLLLSIILCIIIVNVTANLESSINVISNSIILKRVRRIVGGIPITAKKFPFVVSLRGMKYENGTKTYFHFCGGTFYKNWIITAAHCVTKIKAEEMVVFIENPNAKSEADKLHKVNEIILGYYNPHTYFGDIALLKMDFTEDNNNSNKIFANIQDVILPSSVIQPADCLLFGYGSTKYYDKVSKQLRYAKLKVITHEECEDKMGRIVVPQKHWGMFCAEGESDGKGVDACKGDSGGPILCKANGSQDYEFSGIVSYGIGCGNKGTPGVYTSTFFHKTWILETITNK